MITLQICLFGSLLLGLGVICLNISYLIILCSIICCPPTIIPYACILLSCIFTFVVLALIILIVSIPYICILLSCVYTFVIMALVTLIGILAIWIGTLTFGCCFCNLISPYIMSYFYGFFTLIIIPLYCLPCCLILLPISISGCIFLSVLSITLLCFCCIPFVLVSIFWAIITVICIIIIILCCTIVRPNLLTPNLCSNYIVLVSINLLREILL